MKTKILLISVVLLSVLLSCQPVPATSPALTSTPAGQMETRVAATIYAGQTSTAKAEQAEAAALTAAVPLSTVTPAPTPTPNAFYFKLPANACWMNSEIAVRAGQTVVIRGSGDVNTWDGRQGSSGGPNGQTGVCGAIECPLQGVGYGALIGRLEELPPFFVGTVYRFTAEKDGQLYFTINDWKCEDNRGDFEILISFP